ncbi:UNVERIFIED_CONTAM: hypothetical protein ABID98_001988 [Brevibacillus sp. OAP136]
MRKPRIGILTWRQGLRFAEPAYFRRLLATGEHLGATVYLFSPQDVSFASKEVKGYIRTAKGWEARQFGWPDVVIDRFRYTPTQAFKDYVAFRKKQSFLYANNRLANKWKVHQVLWRDPAMHRWLPETVNYSRAGLKEMIGRHPQLYIKPSNGTGGRGILCMKRTKQGYRLLGRDTKRTKVESVQPNWQLTAGKVARWVNNGLFVIQQGLNLDLIPGRSIDMRLLIQKNEHGEWSITGQGMRIGGAKSATANLHGGGQAMRVRPFLERHFSAGQTDYIMQECAHLAKQTANTIEQHFGRMMELGLDIGVDVKGNVWLIEVNPKPGREIFRELGAMDTYKQAIQRPLQYALHLAATREKEKVRAI